MTFSFRYCFSSFRLSSVSASAALSFLITLPLVPLLLYFHSYLLAVPPMAEAPLTPPATPPPVEYEKDVVLSVIDDVIEQAGPSFFTGHPRFQDVPVPGPARPFQPEDCLVIYLLCSAREEKPLILEYIYARLPEETRLMLHHISSHHAVLSAEMRTQLVVLILVGFSAYFHGRTYRQDLRRVISLQNLMVVFDVAAQPPHVRSLVLNRVSNQAQGNPHHFSHIPLFSYLN